MNGSNVDDSILTTSLVKTKQESQKTQFKKASSDTSGFSLFSANTFSHFTSHHRHSPFSTPHWL